MDLVVTRAQAVQSGLAPDRVDALVRSGAWVSLRRSVYLTRPTLPEGPAPVHAVHVAAAVLATGTPAVGSHRSAALVHGLPVVGRLPDPPVVTRVRTTGRGGGSRSATLVAQVPPSECTHLLGATVTTVARTAVDVARTGSDVDAVLVLDAALRRVARSELERVLARQRGWPGSALARRRLDLADGLAESALESLGRLRFAQQGLPTPLLQALVGGPEGAIARVDFLWTHERTVGEADGRLKYTSPAALYEEKLREDRLREAGFEVFRFTWLEALHRPELVAERARRAFARGLRHAA